MQNLQIPDTAETRIILKWLFPPRFSDKHRFTSSRLVSVPSPQKQKSYRLAMKGGGFLGVAGCNCGRPRALQQHRQPPPADPFSPDSIDPKISAFFNISFTSSRSSTVRTLDRRTSWALRGNSIKASAQPFKELPLPSTTSFWEWVAPSTTITHWSL